MTDDFLTRNNDQKSLKIKTTHNQINMPINITTILTKERLYILPLRLLSPL